MSSTQLFSSSRPLHDGTRSGYRGPMIAHGTSVIVAGLMSVLAAEPTGIYLPASESGGNDYLFNPASAELRQALAALPKPKPDDLLDARAVADDLAFLRRANAPAIRRLSRST